VRQQTQSGFKETPKLAIIVCTVAIACLILSASTAEVPTALAAISLNGVT